MAFDSFHDFVNALDKVANSNAFAAVATELEITEIADREMKLPAAARRCSLKSPPSTRVSPFQSPSTRWVLTNACMSLGANSVDEAATELGALMKANRHELSRSHQLLGQALDLRHAKPKL